MKTWTDDDMLRVIRSGGTCHIRRVAAGLAAEPFDICGMDQATSGTSGAVIDLTDAIRLIRIVKELE